MSLATWMQEFYPVDAKDADGDDLMAVEHSLQKWIGLRAENLRRHSLTHIFGSITDDDLVFEISGKTCALCSRHIDYTRGDHRCGKCPLYKVRGNVPCDSRRGDEGQSPFHRGIAFYDTEPMITWLTATKELVLDEKRKPVPAMDAML